jgi:general secretion pathway protein M
MTMGLKDWFLGRTQREQRLVLLMVAIALAVFVWLLVVRPLGASYRDAVQDHLAAVDRHGRVLALVDAVKAAPARPVGATTADLELIVSQAASEAGIALEAMSPNGTNAIELTVVGGRATALAQWLAQLEAQGIAVQQLSMTPLPDGTVNMSARLARWR